MLRTTRRSSQLKSKTHWINLQLNYLIVISYCNPSSRVGLKDTWAFFHPLPKPRTYIYVRLIDGTARIFPNSYAATGNWTHISSVAPLSRDLNLGCFTNWATAAAAGYLGLVLSPEICNLNDHWWSRVLLPPEEQPSDGHERHRREDEDERQEDHLLADEVEGAKLPEVEVVVAIL